LIDLLGKQPRLYVVENELASHDPLRHVAVQILQFSLSFESDKRMVRKILFEALQERLEDLHKCQNYVTQRKYRNLDHLLDELVFEAPFTALIIIDELEDLERLLTQKFQFGIEFLEIGCFKDNEGKRSYIFEPFLDDLGGGMPRPEEGEGDSPDPGELDTVVVPARAAGFEKVFLGEDRWYAVRIHGSMRPQIKFIACYQVAPVSAITHLAPVGSVEPWQGSAKSVVNFSEPAAEISPVRLLKGGRVNAPQNLRYTSRDRLRSAKTLEDLW